jgi:hypothetical protein
MGDKWPRVRQRIPVIGVLSYLNLKNVKEHVCGGGGLMYFGRTFEMKLGHAEILGLVEYDSRDGGAHGGLFGGGVGPFTVGPEGMRHWRGWREEWSVIGIGLGGKESKTI